MRQDDHLTAVLAGIMVFVAGVVAAMILASQPDQRSMEAAAIGVTNGVTAALEAGADVDARTEIG